MKMLMIICPEARQDEVRELIARHDVHAYSELGNVLGEGKTGKKMGTHVWPEKSVLIFTVVDEQKSKELLASLKDYSVKLFKEEGLRAFVLPAESAI